jgi:hypothetical protein
MNLVLTEHSRLAAVRRGVDEATVRSVTLAPEQVVPVRPGREVRQSRVRFPPGPGVYLVRVIVDVTAQAEIVVTVYRTSKIDKYWRTP